MKPGRNDPCPCGSGKKYKKCCQQSDAPSPQKLPPSLDKAQEINHLIALFNSGRFGELEPLAHSLSRRYPSEGLIWKLLGLALLMQGKEALVPLQKAGKLLQNDPELHNYLGIALTSGARYPAAEAAFHKALSLSPRYVEALYNLNLAYMAQGHFAKAESALRRALAINPEYSTAHYGLGLALKAQGKIDEAESHFLKTLQHKPDSAGAHYCLGYLFMEQGRTEEAEGRFQQALAIDPNYSEARIKLGICLAEQGRFAEAEACYRHVLSDNPDDLEACFNLAQIRKTSQSDEVLSRLLDIERRKGHALPDKEACLLHFALGKTLDECGRHDESFAHFLEGARRKRSTLNYSAAATTSRFAKIMHLFRTQEMEKLRNNFQPSQLPIFILGMPRSGTSLVEQIISSHPEVFGAGELPDLLEIATGTIGGGDNRFPEGLPILTPEHIASMGEAYLSRLQRHAPQSLRITDKMPGNFAALGLIHLMLPNARIIHVQRNPVDTCLSCFTQLFQGNMEFSYDLHELGLYYKDYLKLMDHWRTTLPPGAFLDVHYEALVENPEFEARRLIEYCGLEWNDACLNFHQTERSVRTASLAQVRQPIYRSSVDRWKRHERHLQPLLDALRETVS